MPEPTTEPPAAPAAPLPRPEVAHRLLAAAYALLAAAVFAWSYTPTFATAYCCARVPREMGSLWLMQANGHHTALPGTFLLVGLTVALGFTARRLWRGPSVPVMAPIVAVVLACGYALFLATKHDAGMISGLELTGYGHGSIAIALAAVPLTAVHALLQLARRLAHRR